MARLHTRPGNGRLLLALATIALAALLCVGAAAAASRNGGSHSSHAARGGGGGLVDQQPSTDVPGSDRQIPNLTLVEQQIERFYGDTLVGTEHEASADSSYAKEVGRVEQQAKSELGSQLRKRSRAKPAIVLDVDDTTLLTYNYELEVGFAYTPASNAAYVTAEKMPAVFGMPDLVNWAASQHVTVFYVTGRPESQRDATAGNLAKVGYTAPADATHLFLKNTASPPSYLSCGSTCTTIQYKSGTRAYIESQGYEILADIGDQYSDLQGGHAGRTYKLPNPMYYLP